MLANGLRLKEGFGRKSARMSTFKGVVEGTSSVGSYAHELIDLQSFPKFEVRLLYGFHTCVADLVQS